MSADDTTSPTDVLKPADVPAEKECVNKKKKFVPTFKGNVKVLVALVFYVLLNILAAYLFVLIEKHPDNNYTDEWFIFNLEKKFLSSHNNCLSTEDRRFLLKEVVVAYKAHLVNNSHSHPDWSLNNALLLSFSIASTIGYGTVVPNTPGGKVFSLTLAFIFIPFTGLLAAKMGAILAYYVKKSCRSIFGSSPRTKYIGVLVTFLLGLILYVVMPTMLLRFVGNEENWDFLDCLYCVIITLTTIGFGDYVPDPSSHGGIFTTMTVIIWVVAGLAWFATIINLIGNVLSKRAKEIERKVSKPSNLKPWSTFRTKSPTASTKHTDN
uniref:potassium channel subfamily K member 2-like isoform X2 n=1 Tax=Ciona intestinalis TaxID=7719 RepID=UPI00089DA8F0|nr:potassium channel subfamily K member 2-like isoform X2 [Ciona intestinalis]|eukprot:XP_018666947.1 potassium channel subfamily K member 2-like isoform X2 [Ciona intestinalis]